MSFILNALRKSEQERKSLNPEDLAERLQNKQWQPRHPKTGGVYKSLVIANMVLILGVMGFAWYYFKTPTPAPAPALSVSVSKPVVSTAVEVDADSSQVELSTPKPLDNVPMKTTSIANWIEIQKFSINTDKPDEAKIIEFQPVKQQPKTKSEKIDQVEKKIAHPVTSEPGVVAQLESKPKPLLSKPNTSLNKANTPFSQSTQVFEQDSKQSSQEELPFLRELPVEFRNAVPSFKVNVFVYAVPPEDSFVMIDGEKYKEGQTVQPGLLLKEIRAESMVLMYQGRLFQINRI